MVGTANLEECLSRGPKCEVREVVGEDGGVER